MNTKYATGPVIRSAEAASFAQYAFPAQLPTEEWAGDEARSYDNYIRPIANLFENDRAQEAFVKELIEGTFIPANTVLAGCRAVNTEGTNYYEITEGIFLYNRIVYHVFPACEAAAKQIEAIAQSIAIDTNVKIWYDGVYHYNYTLNLVEVPTQTSTTAAGAISAILTGLSIPSNKLAVENSIILPVFTRTGKFYFDGNSICVGDSVEPGVLELNVAPNSMIDGSRITDNSLTNAKIQNNFVKIGSTAVSLGSSSADFAGINTINGVKQESQSNNIKITAASAAIICPADKSYTLNDACAKAVETNSSLSIGDALPTVNAVKGYVSNYVNTEHFTGNNIEFENGIKISGGKVKVLDTTDATASSGAVSELASIYTAGGIESKGSICSEKNIIGLNSGTYSSRAYKENITPFTESAVDLINTIDVVNYTYKADEEHNHKIGFIADDTHEYFATKFHNIMDQSNCIGLLLKAVQELSAENRELRNEINELRNNA